MDTNKINELSIVLGTQNEVLDAILKKQALLHDAVTQRNWVDLENYISDLEAYGNAFVELDQRRELLAGNDRNVYFSNELLDLYTQLRLKLTKSKIENQALNTYIEASQEFIAGVIDECVPQQRSTVYNRYGNMVKSSASSVLLDKLL